ncbi:MAG: U32 family peptidase [Candidatus Omnitrophica bacterium]|nr:U32 family peptidase [Candidatus Omnitrophota bacterium]
MRLSVPHNWQEDLLESLDLSFIEEFYGKLEKDVIGGGRSANISPPVSRKTLKREVQKIHQKGLKFNYLLNSNCIDNRELLPSVQRRLSRLLDWLKDLSVDSLTVSLPFILLFTKKRYPEFRLSVSTMAGVDTPDKAKYWEDLGVSKITLDEVNVNRDFKLIRRIKKAVKCKLQLIANNGCLHNCPFTVYHGLLCSHASQQGHRSQCFVIDFYRIMCSYLRVKEPVNFIRADWIRPEDLAHYEDLGIDSIKIVNRGMATSALKNIVAAYSRRKYEGNLLDLLPSPAKNLNIEKPRLFHLFRYFFHPWKVNIFKLLKLKNAFKEDVVFIDNRELDGFLSSLQDKDCNMNSCVDCGWCAETANRAVKINSEKIKKSLKSHRELIDEFISGKFFKYL